MHDVSFIEGIAENITFQLFDFGVDGLADGLIALGHKVEQGIEYKILAMLQKQRAGLAALTYSPIGG